MIVGVGGRAGLLPLLVPLVMKWSLIDLSMWSHLAQKDGAQPVFLSEKGVGVGGSLDYTHDTCPPWDFMISLCLIFATQTLSFEDKVIVIQDQLRSSDAGTVRLQHKPGE